MSSSKPFNGLRCGWDTFVPCHASGLSNAHFCPSFRRVLFAEHLAAVFQASLASGRNTKGMQFRSVASAPHHFSVSRVSPLGFDDGGYLRALFRFDLAT